MRRALELGINLNTVYRGTQRRDIKGARKGLSFTPSLPVAVIWSARPGDVWSRTRTAFLPTSTVHTAQLRLRNPLILGEGCYNSLSNILKMLRYDYVGGISEGEVTKIYNYLHNRLIGKAKGGEFLFKVLDEDYEEIDDDVVPFSLSIPDTLISWVAREEWHEEPTIETAAHLVADTYIFVDAPAVQRAALSQGYDSIVYVDVFAGGTWAAEDLLGCDVEELDGITMDYDIEDEYVPTHWSLRLLDADIVESMTAKPTEEIVATVDLCEPV
jgi:hypothetical protein